MLEHADFKNVYEGMQTQSMFLNSSIYVHIDRIN